MELLAKGKVFRVETGTKVMVNYGFTFSRARKIRVLEGEHSGKEGVGLRGHLGFKSQFSAGFGPTLDGRKKADCKIERMQPFCMTA
jgi:hypothetical protein